MHPVLFHVGTVPIPTHDFFTGLGVVTATVLMLREADRRGRLDRRLLFIAAGGLLGGAIGARAGMAWRYLTLAHHPTVLGLLVDSGKTIVGGLAGAYAGVLLAKRAVGYREHTGDYFAIAVALGLAIGRIGCFLTEPPGHPTSLPWGVHMTPDRLARHPSFLYETLFLVLLAGGLRWLRPRLDAAPGELFVVFLGSYAMFRFGVEFVRQNDIWILGLTRSQVFLLATFPLLATHVVRQARAGTYQAVLHPTASKEVDHVRRAAVRAGGAGTEPV